MNDASLLAITTPRYASPGMQDKRKFDPEFKRRAVELLINSDKSGSEKSQKRNCNGLRLANEEHRMERDILKEAEALFMER